MIMLNNSPLNASYLILQVFVMPFVRLPVMCSVFSNVLETKKYDTVGFDQC
jgi:hypothetical protein